MGAIVQFCCHESETPRLADCGDDALVVVFVVVLVVAAATAEAKVLVVVTALVYGSDKLGVIELIVVALPAAMST
jgi:hypothetical protein